MVKVTGDKNKKRSVFLLAVVLCSAILCDAPCGCGYAGGKISACCLVFVRFCKRFSRMLRFCESCGYKLLWILYKLTGWYFWASSYLLFNLLWVAISTFSPAGTFRVSFLVGFVCPCIMLCLWRVLHRLGARRSPLPVVSRCSTQKRHVITCSTEQLCSREFSAHAVDFCTNRFYARVLSWKIVL